MTPAPPRPLRPPYHILSAAGMWLGVALLLLLAPTRAPAASLADLLASVAVNDRFPTPARAELHGERRGAGAEQALRGVLVGRGRTIYIEMEGGTRALVRPGKIVVAGPRRARRGEPGTPLAGTDLLLEDLTSFTPARLTTPQISDDGPTGVVVNGAPAAPSAYVLLVQTIEAESGTITRTQYYRDSISELVKIRRDDAFVQVSGHWRPSDVTVESFRDKTTTHLKLDWTPVPATPPEVFTLAGLRGASQLAAEH